MITNIITFLTKNRRGVFSPHLLCTAIPFDYCKGELEQPICSLMSLAYFTASNKHILKALFAPEFWSQAPWKLKVLEKMVSEKIKDPAARDFSLNPALENLSDESLREVRVYIKNTLHRIESTLSGKARVRRYEKPGISWDKATIVPPAP